jgi:hypothetical protein
MAAPDSVSCLRQPTGFEGGSLGHRPTGGIAISVPNKPWGATGISADEAVLRMHDKIVHAERQSSTIRRALQFRKPLRDSWEFGSIRKYATAYRS